MSCAGFWGVGCRPRLRLRDRDFRPPPPRARGLDSRRRVGMSIDGTAGWELAVRELWVVCTVVVVVVTTSPPLTPPGFRRCDEVLPLLALAPLALPLALPLAEEPLSLGDLRVASVPLVPRRL